MHEESKRRVILVNAFYNSVRNLLSYCRLSRHIQIKLCLYRTTVLPVLYGCRTWSLTLSKSHRLKVLENRVLRKISGPEGKE
jgi:hypothetical protein